VNIYTISRPSFDVEEFLTALQRERTSWKRSPNANDSEEVIEVAGRLCYFSFGDVQSEKSNADFIRHLIKMGHNSVLEHVNWTFLITGISRTLTHQLVRHRVGVSFSQLSQQFHDETDATFIEPDQLRHFPELLSFWEKAVSSSKQAYTKLKNALESSGTIKDQNVIRSIARSLLPNATATKLVMTANARELRHLIKLRGSRSCDEEMRRFIAGLLQKLKNESSVLFSDFSVVELPDGSPYIQQVDM